MNCNIEKFRDVLALYVVVTRGDESAPINLLANLLHMKEKLRIADVFAVPIRSVAVSVAIVVHCAGGVEFVGVEASSRVAYSTKLGIDGTCDWFGCPAQRINDCLGWYGNKTRNKY